MEGFVDAAPGAATVKPPLRVAPRVTKAAPTPRPPRSPPPAEVVEAIASKAAAKSRAAKSSSLSFTAELWAPMEGKGWTFASLPAETSAVLGARGRVPVVATVGGQSFRTSCFPDGKGGHTLQLNAAMRAAAGAGPGDTVAFSLAPASDDVAVEVPADLAKALRADKGAKAQWDAITPKARAEWTGWVTSAKRAETRSARVAKAVERLRGGAKRPSE